MSAMTLLSSYLDDGGWHTEAENVRNGVDLESYENELSLIDWLLRHAHPAQPAQSVDVERLLAALGHVRVPNTRCLARVAKTPPQLRPPGPHNPPIWCCLPAGHDGQHRHNGGGMYPSILFRATDEVVMGDPLPDYCEKCRHIWPCEDAKAITAAIDATTQEGGR